MVSPPGGGSAGWLVRRVVVPPGGGSTGDECAGDESADGKSAGHRIQSSAKKDLQGTKGLFASVKMRAAELPLANNQQEKSIRRTAKKGLRGTNGLFASVKMRAA